MHTIREITRLATIFVALIAPRLCLGFASATTRLRLDYASTTPRLRLASISCEHCRSSRNNLYCAPRHVIYYCCMYLFMHRRKIPSIYNIFWLKQFQAIYSMYPYKKICRENNDILNFLKIERLKILQLQNIWQMENFLNSSCIINFLWIKFNIKRVYTTWKSIHI